MAAVQDVVAGRTGKQIEAAKRAQTARLGQSGASGKRKRCKKGKSCGASCIFASKVCMVDLPWASSRGLSKAAKTIQDRPVSPGPKPPARPPAPKPPVGPPVPMPKPPVPPGQPSTPPGKPGQPPAAPQAPRPPVGPPAPMPKPPVPPRKPPAEPRPPEQPPTPRPPEPQAPMPKPPVPSGQPPAPPGRPGQPEQPGKPPAPRPPEPPALPGRPGQPPEPRPPAQPPAPKPPAPPRPPEQPPATPQPPEPPARPPAQPPTPRPPAPSGQPKEKKRSRLAGWFRRLKGKSKDKVRELVKNLRDRGVSREKIKQKVKELRDRLKGPKAPKPSAKPPEKPARKPKEVTLERYERAKKKLEDALEKTLYGDTTGKMVADPERYSKLEKRLKDLIEKVGPLVGSNDKFEKYYIFKKVYGKRWKDVVKDDLQDAGRLKKVSSEDIRKAQERLFRKRWKSDSTVRVQNASSGKENKKLVEEIMTGLRQMGELGGGGQRVKDFLEALSKNPVAVFSHDGSVGQSVSSTSNRDSKFANIFGTKGEIGVRALIKHVVSDDSEGAVGGFAAMARNIVVIFKRGKEDKFDISSVTRDIEKAAKGSPLSWNIGGNPSVLTYLHEVGHILNARAYAVRVGDIDKDRLERDMAASINAAGLKPVSRYGDPRNSDHKEFFAEMFVAYMVNGDALRKNMPKEYDYVDRMVRDAYKYDPSVHKVLVN